MKNIIYYKKLLQLIESLKNKEIYPEQYSGEELKHKLADLYMGWYLSTDFRIPKEDREILIIQVLPDIFVSLTQSLFYDVMMHFDVELYHFILNYDEFREIFSLAEESLQNIFQLIDTLTQDIRTYKKREHDDKQLILTGFINNLQLSKQLFKQYSKDYQKDLEEIKNALFPFAQKLDEEFNFEGFSPYTLIQYSIDEWIKTMQKIPSHIWKKYAYFHKNIKNINNDIEKIYKWGMEHIYQKIETILKNMINKFNIWNRRQVAKNLFILKDYFISLYELASYTFDMFHFLDEPYYEAFINGIEPYYFKLKTYLSMPTEQNLKQVMIIFDHLKDLQHHSNFFWDTLDKPTMDFISHAKIFELAQYITNSKIRKIYNQYQHILQ